MQFVDLSADDSDIEHAYNIDHVSETDEDDLPTNDGHSEGDAEAPEPRVEPIAPIIEAPQCNDEEVEQFSRGIDAKKRVCAKWVMLTYPALGGGKPDINSWQAHFKSIGATAGVISRERHRDGSWHIHALLEKATKWDCGLKFFDHVKHPNIRTVLHGKWEGAEEYVLKDGDYLRWNLREVPATSRNYVKRKQDREAWLRDVRQARFSQQVDVLDLPNGEGKLVLNEPGKRRGIVLVGEADFGKTTWLLSELRGTKYYQVRNERNPWDQWNDARVVVWNDCDFWPNKGDLCFLLTWEFLIIKEDISQPGFLIDAANQATTTCSSSVTQTSGSNVPIDMNDGFWKDLESLF